MDIQLIGKIITIAQWSIIGLFVLIYTIIGIRRGAKKSLYYTITSLTLTALLMFLISLFTVRIIFPQPSNLINFLVNTLKMDSSNQLIVYLNNPALSGVIFGFIDIIFQIVLFMIIYPIVKFILTVTILRPIYNKWFSNEIKSKNPLLVQANKLKNKKNVLSRLSGGLLGLFRGFIVGFLILLPTTVILGSVSGIKTTNQSNETINRLIYNNTNKMEQDVKLNSDVENVLHYVEVINDNALINMSKSVKIGNKSIDEILFDFTFNGNIKYTNGTKSKLKIGSELRMYGDIINTLIEAGYLDSDFDVNSINYEDDFENFELIFEMLGDSNALNLIIPILTDGITTIEEDGKKIFDLDTNANLRKSYNLLMGVKWNEESKEILDVIEQLLLLGSVGELQSYAKNSKEFFLLENDQQQRLGKAVSEVGDLKSLYLTNFYIELLLQSESIKVDWEEDSEAYLREKLSFITDKPSLLVGEEGQINKIGLMLQGMFNKEITEFDWNTFFNESGKVNLNQLLEEDSLTLLSHLLTSLGDIELITKSIPLGVDFLLQTNTEQAIKDISEEFSNLVESIDFEKEFNNINEIYKGIVDIGLSKFIGSNIDYLKVTDELFNDPDTIVAVKKVVDDLLVNSQLVNQGLDIVSDVVIDKLIKNTELKDLLLKLVNEEDFKLSQELISMIDIGISVYDFSDYKTIQTQFKAKNQVETFYDFGGLTELEFDNFKSNILDLQMFKYASIEAFEMLVSILKVKNIVIPDNATNLSVTSDLERIFDLTYSVGHSINTSGVSKEDLKDSELSEIIDYQLLSEALEFDSNKDKDSIILHSLVNFIKNGNFKLGEFATLGAPDELLALDANNEAWSLELNSIIQTILKVLTSESQNDNDIKFTFNVFTGGLKFGGAEIFGLMDRFVLTLNKVNIDPVTGEDDLDKFTNSLIVQNLFNDLVTSDKLDQTLNTTLEGIFNKDITGFTTKPENSQIDPTTNMFSKKEIKNLLISITYLDLVKDGVIKFELNDLFNVIDKNEFELLLSSNYLRVILSRILTLNEVKELLATGAGFNVNDLTLNDTIKDSDGNLETLEIKNLIVAFRALGITDFNNINIDMTILKELVSSSDTFETILESNYLYQVIDLILKTQLTNIPNEALNQTEPFLGYISKGEIISLIKAFNSLGLNSGNDINIDMITVDTLESIIAQDSIIIRAILSKELLKVIDFPAESLEETNSELIKNNEILVLIKAIKIIQDDSSEPINNINFNNLELTTAKYIQLIELQVDYQSPVINHIIINSIPTI